MSFGNVMSYMIYRLGDPIPHTRFGRYVQVLVRWYLHDHPDRARSFNDYAAHFIFILAAKAVVHWREQDPNQDHLEAIAPYFALARPTITYAEEIWDLLHYLGENLPETFFGESAAKEVYQSLRWVNSVDPVFRTGSTAQFASSLSSRWIDSVDVAIADVVDHIVRHLKSKGTRFSAAEEEATRSELTNMLGSSYMAFVFAQMAPEQRETLSKIVARKKADDQFIEKWRFGLSSHWLTTVRQFLEKLDVPQYSGSSELSKTFFTVMAQTLTKGLG